MTYQVRAMIEDTGCGEFRVLCARDFEFEVVISSVLLDEKFVPADRFSDCASKKNSLGQDDQSCTNLQLFSITFHASAFDWLNF